MDGFPNMGTKPRNDPPPGGTWAHSSSWEPAKIPPRPWIARGYLLRGAVTAIVGAGGVSKSMLMICYAVAAALGRNYHGMHPNGEYRVAIYNAEDDDFEQQRRLTAVLTSMGVTPDAIVDKVMRTGPTRVATLMARDESGELYRTPAMEQLVENVRAFKADVLIMDPLAELHTEEENANIPLREVMAEFRSLAKELNMAIVLVHHVRKGNTEPGDMDAARGASSMVSAARVGLTVVGMTAEDAKALGLAQGTHKHYFRLDGGKSNYGPLSECEWFERVSYSLEQEDTVGLPVPWSPPVDVVTLDIRAAVVAAIERGSPAGPWSPKLENRPRSVKHAMVEAGITTMDGQKDLLATLFREGFETVQFRDLGRKWAQGIRSPDGKPASAEWREVSDEGGES
jgi:hypothetical protein